MTPPHKLTALLIPLTLGFLCACSEQPIRFATNPQTEGRSLISSQICEEAGRALSDEEFEQRILSSYFHNQRNVWKSYDEFRKHGVKMYEPESTLNQTYVPWTAGEDRSRVAIFVPRMRGNRDLIKRVHVTLDNCANVTYRESSTELRPDMFENPILDEHWKEGNE